MASDPDFHKDEIFVDSFAGGGGASTGIEYAIGRNVDEAVNHDPAAIAMHEANHPQTRHHCEDVWSIHPRVIAAGRRVGLLWLSPDCTHHSKARGGKPREKGIRGLAWTAVWWAATVRPRVIMLENVEEFADWGPLDAEGKPIKAQKGRTFRTFVNALKRQGYEVEWRILRACDYGAPTIRKRLFLIARCDGQAIVWPEPTHVQVDKPFKITAGGPLPYRRAADIIDWSIPVPSIFGRKRELADNTKRRIARGIDKFILQVAAAGGVPFMAPFLVNVNHGGEGFRGQGLGEPLQTITGKNGIGLVVPHITKFRGGSTGHSIDEPLHTITSGAGATRPAGAAHAMGMVTASLVKHYGGNYNGAGNSLEDPLSTITTTDHNALLCASLIQMGYGERPGQDPRVLDIGSPLGTITAGGNKFGLMTAHIARHFGESIGSDMADPVGTVTAGGGGKSALVASHLIKFRGDNIGSGMDAPVPTITAGGQHLAAVYAFMVAYYGSSVGQDMADPLGTVTTHDRFGLVLVRIRGVDYVIVDIGMRMLTPRELYRAQGFPESYIINPIFNGKPFTQAEQVAKCGNSVSPVMSAALTRANLPEHCVPRMADRFSKLDRELLFA
ncbi:DNA cytosine methyltransferase [Cohnella nanjingensis]|uniref:DNA cytosine methyltransferase n=1 Tax=Cohnella nanjingensis TaxID=1387779 RepID=UPI0035E40937